MTLPCIPLDGPPPNHTIVFPGGLTISTPPMFRPYDRLLELEGMFAALSPAMAAMGPVFTVLEALVATVEFCKALATLNPVEIADAFVAFVTAAEKLLGLTPQLSLPLMIYGMLGLILDLLTTLIDFLQDIQQLQTDIDNMKHYAETYGLEGMAEDALCLEGNLETRMEYFNNAIGMMAVFMVLVEALAGIAGLDISLSFEVGDADAIDDILDALGTFVDTVAAVMDAIPLP